MTTELNRKRNNNCSQFDESTACDITFQQLKKSCLQSMKDQTVKCKSYNLQRSASVRKQSMRNTTMFVKKKKTPT